MLHYSAYSNLKDQLFTKVAASSEKYVFGPKIQASR